MSIEAMAAWRLVSGYDFGSQPPNPTKFDFKELKAIVR